MDKIKATVMKNAVKVEFLKAGEDKFQAELQTEEKEHGQLENMVPK